MNPRYVEMYWGRLRKWFKKPRTLYNIGVGLKGETSALNSVFNFENIYGCEPFNPSYDKLKTEFPGNLLNCAISTIPPRKEDEKTKSPILHYNPTYPQSGGLKRHAHHNSQQTCDILTLDAFDIFFGKCSPSIFLWADVEGSELEVLESGPRLLSSRRVVVINLELRKTTDKPVTDLLASHGYRRLKKWLDQRTHFDSIYVRV